ncbi:hypothetical protein like AT5G57330 [Hibiscus trionum]|uniref:glucose-6-phosphate 1-epimerase n=1 Tax=Hibiscus trionum TaxID=183268 RepID=A0A9W7H8N5_HIBTR|nr:hypothetical protein like AT5G57330 [Hibiscus trionum]
MFSEKLHVEHRKGVNGLDKVILRENRQCSAEVYLYGGQVTSWKNVHGVGEELLFFSSKASFRPPRAICGGILICFPQFGNIGSLERHGFARNRIWSVDPDPPPCSSNIPRKAFIDLILRNPEEDMKIWPHMFECRLGVALGSTGDLIPNFPSPISVKYEFTEQEDAITFESEVDKVYLSTPTKVAILDHERKRTFELRKYGLPDAVVWNPWDKKAKAACIEEPITLKPGEEWRERQEISTVPSSYCSEQLDPRRLLLSG